MEVRRTARLARKSYQHAPFPLVQTDIKILSPCCKLLCMTIAIRAWDGCNCEVKDGCNRKARGG
eukprot:scaffold156321_cov16-Tisochrysis_lutea.AAC.1